MAANGVSEQQIVQALHRLPVERWAEVLRYVEGLTVASPPTADQPPPVRTGADLATSDLIGIWADRTDLGDGKEFARRLRQEASHRRGSRDASGH